MGIGSGAWIYWIMRRRGWMIWEGVGSGTGCGLYNLPLRYHKQSRMIYYGNVAGQIWDLGKDWDIDNGLAGSSLAGEISELL